MTNTTTKIRWTHLKLPVPSKQILRQAMVLTRCPTLHEVAVRGAMTLISNHNRAANRKKKAAAA